LDSRYWILDTGCWILDAGYWMLDTGLCERGARSRILDTGFWSLRFKVYLVLGSWFLYLVPCTLSLFPYYFPFPNSSFVHGLFLPAVASLTFFISSGLTNICDKNFGGIILAYCCGTPNSYLK